MKGRLVRLAVLALVILALAAAFSQQKYAGQVSLYRKNTDALEASVEQLKTLMAAAKRAEPDFADREEYVEVHFGRDGDTVTLCSLSRKEGEGYGVFEEEHSLSEFPALEAALLPLREAGLSSVSVYDFSHTAAWMTGSSPCEIWFGVDGGSLVYSESGALTHSWDVTDPDGPGCRFYQKKIGPNWFATVSRYDPDSSYWRT